MEIELKKCPFCGGEAKLITGITTTSVFNNEHPAFMVRCAKCSAGTKEFVDVGRDGAGLVEAVRSWNRRAGEDDGI